MLVWVAGFGVAALLGLVGVVLLLRQIRRHGASTVTNIAIAFAVPAVLLSSFIAIMMGVKALSQTKLKSPKNPYGEPAVIDPVSKSDPRVPSASQPTKATPALIDFKVLRVENPPGTRDILLHFQRDAQPALGLEVWQDVTSSPGLRKQPKSGYRNWQQKTWVGGTGPQVLGWTLPDEFTEAEVREAAKTVARTARELRHLPEGALLEFATLVHRDGWKYHLLASVARAPGAGPVAPTAPESVPPSTAK